MSIRKGTFSFLFLTKHRETLSFLRSNLNNTQEEQIEIEMKKIKFFFCKKEL